MTAQSAPAREIRTGERNDATVYATYSWPQARSSRAGGLSGWALDGSGTSRAPVGRRPAAVRPGGHLYPDDPGSAIPLGISRVPRSLVPLFKKRVETNVATLKAAHEDTAQP